MDILKTTNKLIGKIVNRVTSSVSQTAVRGDEGAFAPIEGVSALCERAAADSFVLLKNENGVLPLDITKTTALFGTVQLDPFYVGFGSGGDVNAHYTVGFAEGLGEFHVAVLVAQFVGADKDERVDTFFQFFGQ